MIILKLHFVKINPVENMTIFVLDPVPRKEHLKIANKLMNYNNIHGEQVGFIEKEDSHIRLQMMGGEFCGNATRSLAAYMVHSEYSDVKRVQRGYEVSLRVSGVDKIVKCIVTSTDNKNSYFSQIDMPLPLSIENYHFYKDEKRIKTIKVNMPGIAHFIVDSSRINNKNEFYNIIKEQMDEEKYDAFGIMYYDYEKNFLSPLVYVRATNSLYWERSCASGTAALAIALAYKKKDSIAKKIQQPGGILEISANWTDDNISKVRLNGLVNIVAEGISYI